MRLHDLSAVPGARKRRKRVGCGESSGHGKTSCRGHKGQKARSGSAIRPGFEGGQMPMHRRLPKKGFSNAAFQDKILTVSIAKLELAFDDGAMVTVAALREKRLVRGQFDAVKILGDGELTKKLTVAIESLSLSAREKVEKAGGSVVAAS
jgi:large subunit ribosomal protein L15